jgi:hypothetical protein
MVVDCRVSKRSSNKSEGRRRQTWQIAESFAALNGAQRDAEWESLLQSFFFFFWTQGQTVTSVKLLDTYSEDQKRCAYETN